MQFFFLQIRGPIPYIFGEEHKAQIQRLMGQKWIATTMDNVLEDPNDIPILFDLYLNGYTSK